LIDSELSLDADASAGETRAMTPEPLLLHRIDPARNMARFYRLSIEPNLFGGVSLVRTWGRIDGASRAKIEFFDGAADAIGSFARLERSKRRRGYVGQSARD
jgi:predicted DNA-binding WGR domain protein